ERSGGEEHHDRREDGRSHGERLALRLLGSSREASLLRGQERSNKALRLATPMANFAVHGTWRSVLALTSLITFTGLLAYGLAGGVPQPALHALPFYGLLLYVLAIAVIVLGFWSKED